MDKHIMFWDLVQGDPVGNITPTLIVPRLDLGHREDLFWWAEVFDQQRLQKGPEYERLLVANWSNEKGYQIITFFDPHSPYGLGPEKGWEFWVTAVLIPHRNLDGWKQIKEYRSSSIELAKKTHEKRIQYIQAMPVNLS